MRWRCKRRGDRSSPADCDLTVGFEASPLPYTIPRKESAQFARMLMCVTTSRSSLVFVCIIYPVHDLSLASQTVRPALILCHSVTAVPKMSTVMSLRCRCKAVLRIQDLRTPTIYQPETAPVDVCPLSWNFQEFASMPVLFVVWLNRLQVESYEGRNLSYHLLMAVL
jgi:hypothetical protein